MSTAKQIYSKEAYALATRSGTFYKELRGMPAIVTKTEAKRGIEHKLRAYKVRVTVELIEELT